MMRRSSRYRSSPTATALVVLVLVGCLCTLSHGQQQLRGASEQSEIPGRLFDDEPHNNNNNNHQVESSYLEGEQQQQQGDDETVPKTAQAYEENQDAETVSFAPRVAEVLTPASMMENNNEQLSGQMNTLPPPPPPPAGSVEGAPVARKFISYTPSAWEQMWLRNVDAWANERAICEVLLHEQSFMVHDFLNLLCTSHLPEPYSQWCVIDDAFHPLWYNTANRSAFELYWERPPTVPEDVQVPPPQSVIPTEAHEHIVSKFVFANQHTGEYYTEYIEPLVSHLRFPLSKCLQPIPNDVEHEWWGTVFRGHYLPPPPGVRQRAAPDSKMYYFDAGASSWDKGAGGPSLSYFTTIWDRYGIDFDSIYAFELTTKVEEFYKTLPHFMHPKVHYRQCEVSSHPSKHSQEHLFLPLHIKNVAKNPDDYVLFKLDIDSPTVEDGNIFFILDDESNRIDEVVWEHHIRGNYLMNEWRGPNGEDEFLPELTMRQSYEFFLKMREKGIRAHSWI